MFYVIGCLISILNHTLTISIIKYIDRLYIMIGFIIDMLVYKDEIMIIYLISSVLFYLIGKITRTTENHLLSHIIISLYHSSLV